MRISAQEANKFWRRAHIQPNGCWFRQTPHRSLATHYARTRWRGKVRQAHQIAWLLTYGTIPSYPRRVLDHLCKNKACVNTRHMEVVTIGENVLRGNSSPAINARKTHCQKGHLLFGDNCYRDPKYGRRRCRICDHQTYRQRYETKK